MISTSPKAITDMEAPEPTALKKLDSLLDELAALRQRQFYIKSRFKDISIINQIAPGYSSERAQVCLGIATELLCEQQAALEKEVFDIVFTHFPERASEHSMQRLRLFEEKERNDVIGEKQPAKDNSFPPMPPPELLGLPDSPPF